MLSRIMRHPAGFMRKALRRNFLADTFARSEPAIRPYYWMNRFSGVGLSLKSRGDAAAPAQAATEGAPATRTAAPQAVAPGSGNPSGGSLPRQGGKAASFLLAGREQAAHP